MRAGGCRLGTPIGSGRSRMTRRRLASAWAWALLCVVASASLARAAETRFHGLLDLVAAERAPAYDLNRLTRGDNPFDAYGVRLFADAQVNDRLQVFSQVVLRDESGIYVDGAYLMFTPRPTLDLHVLA